MRSIGMVLILAFAVTPLLAQENMAGPTNEKAQKSYKQGMSYLNQHMMPAALESFTKADKQDGGRCQACQGQIIKCGIGLGDWKAAETAAEEMVEEAQGATSLALAHYEFGMVLMDEGLGRHKDEPFERAHDEMTKALAAAPNFPAAVYKDGIALAHMNQDAAAKARFEQFVHMAPANDPNRQ